MRSKELLKIATALDPQNKNLNCSSDDEKQQTWTLIEQQIASYDWMKTNAQGDTDTPIKLYATLMKSVLS